VSVLIVLFGQENEPDGKLRLPAAARCAKAAKVYNELASGNQVLILPTGAFGSHFNQTDQPHFHYLRQELIALGVPPENILPGTITSTTVQDCTEAWYRFKSGGYHRLVAVTSDYHAERVAFILSRLSGGDDAEIEVVPADTPSGYTGKDREEEKVKVERLRREWVDVIPRNADVPPGRLMAVYAEAGREQQHYDTLSLAVLSALFIVNAFAFSIVPGRGLWPTMLLLIALAAIDLLLWSLYNRMAEAARTARRVLSRIEIEHRIPGFSSNWRPQTREWFRLPPWEWSMKELVTALAAILFLTLAATALFSVGEQRTETVPTRSVYSNSNANANVGSAGSNSANGNALDRWANRVLGPEENRNTNTNTRRR
jgi:uncharacterized SAM-binding protein YcdF (DUF218 family)